MPPLKPVSSEAAAAATAAAAAAGPAGPAALAAALAELSGPSAIGQVGEGKPELGGDDAAKAAAGGAEDVDNAAALAAVAAPSGAGPTEALPAVEAEGTGAGKGKGKENDAVDADSGGEGKGKPDDPKGKDAEAGKSEEPAAGASGADDHRDCTDDQRRKRSETLGNATRLEKDMTGMLRRVIDDIYQVRFREHGALPSAFPCPFLLRAALPPSPAPSCSGVRCRLRCCWPIELVSSKRSTLVTPNAMSTPCHFPFLCRRQASEWARRGLIVVAVLSLSVSVQMTTTLHWRTTTFKAG